MFRYRSGKSIRGVEKKKNGNNYSSTETNLNTSSSFFNSLQQQITPPSGTVTRIPNIKRFKSSKNLKKFNPFKSYKKYYDIKSGLSFLSSNQFKLNHSSKLTSRPLEFLFSDQFKSFYSTSSNIKQLYLNDIKDYTLAELKVDTPSINADTNAAPSISSLVGNLVSKFKYAYSRSDEFLRSVFKSMIHYQYSIILNKS